MGGVICESDAAQFIADGLAKFMEQLERENPELFKQAQANLHTVGEPVKTACTDPSQSAALTCCACTTCSYLKAASVLKCAGWMVQGIHAHSANKAGQPDLESGAEDQPRRSRTFAQLLCCGSNRDYQPLLVLMYDSSSAGSPSTAPTQVTMP